MNRSQLTLMSLAMLALSGATQGADSSSLVPISQAVQVAQASVAGADTPIKAELNVADGPMHYEVKTFLGTTLWEVKINPTTGVAFVVDSSNGGGAQDKIAEAQTVIAQSIYTLAQAIDQAAVLYPDYFLTQIEMRVRNGLAIFDMDLVRGAYMLEVRMRASDGVVVKESTHLLTSADDRRNLHIPDDAGSGPSPLPSDVAGFLTANQIIVAAQQQFAGAKAFDVELDELTGGTFRYEIRLLHGAAVIKAKYHPVSGALLNSQTITDAQYVARVQAAVNNSTLTLLQAVNAARVAAPGRFVDEAELRLQSSGLLFKVEFLTNAGAVEVKVNSTTGAVTSIEFEN